MANRTLSRRSGSKGTSVLQRQERQDAVASLFAANYSIPQAWAEIQRRAREEGKPHFDVTQRTIATDRLVIYRQLRERTVEAGEKMRDEQTLKLQAIERRMAPMLDHPNPAVVVKAAEVLLRVHDRYAKMYGTDAPQQLEIADMRDHLTVEIVTAEQVDAAAPATEDADADA